MFRLTRNFLRGAAKPDKIRSYSTKLFQKLTSDVVLVGSGPATIRALKLLGNKKFRGKVTVVSKDSGTPWMQSIQQNNPYFRLGQSKKTLLEMPPDQLYAPNERMSIDDFLRNQVNESVQAVESFEAEQLDYFEGVVSGVWEEGPGVSLALNTGAVIYTRHLVFATGVGPEKDLAAANVKLLNQPIGPRVVLDESTTAIKSFAKSGDYFAGKSILVYGGSATAAWASENAALKGVDHFRWVSAAGFDGANPNGNNNEIMDLTQNLRMNAKIESIEYEGDLSTGSGIKVMAVSRDTNKQITFHVDKIIAALGSNPLGPTGIQHTLGTQLYSQLRQLRIGTGFVATNKSNSLIVTIAPLSGDKRFQDEIDNVLKLLPMDTRIAPSIAAVRASANAAVEVITEIPPADESSAKEKFDKATAAKKETSLKKDD